MSQNESQTVPTRDPVTAVESNPRLTATDATTGSPQPHAGGPLGLPRTYWVLWGGMLINRLGGSVFFLLAIYLTRERGLRPELAGIVMSLYAAGGMIAGPIGGVLADRAGRRATLLAGTAGAGTLMLALGSARTTGAIVALAPLLGFFSDLCRPPLQAAVADVVAPEQRARAYGLLYWAINLGFAGAASLGGVLAAHSFSLLFVVDALTTFAFGAVVLAGVPETRPAVALEPQRPRGGRALLEPFRDGPFLKFVAIQLLLMLAFAQVIVALPLDMHRHGLGTAQIGWLLGLNGVFIVIGQPIALRFGRRLSHLQWLVAGAVLTGLGLGATALANGALVYALAAVVWTLGEIGFSTAVPTLIAGFSPVAQRGAYQGTYQLAWGLATMAAPVLGSLALGHLGGRALWVGCLIACWSAAALHLKARAASPP